MTEERDAGEVAGADTDGGSRAAGSAAESAGADSADAADDDVRNDGQTTGAATGDADAGEDPAAVAGVPTAELAAEVTAHDEELGEAVAALVAERDALAERTEELDDELEERTERLQRTQADFQNYKKRAERRREQLEERATEDLVERLLEVRDNLARALEADGDLRDGVEATLRSFDDVLAAEDVERIEPDPGAAVDPHRHEVLMRVESDQPADSVAECYRPGFEMGDSLLRAAQVTVSEDGDGTGDADAA